MPATTSILVLVHHSDKAVEEELINIINIRCSGIMTIAVPGDSALYDSLSLPSAILVVPLSKELLPFLRHARTAKARVLVWDQTNSTHVALQVKMLRDGIKVIVSAEPSEVAGAVSRTVLKIQADRNDNDRLFTLGQQLGLKGSCHSWLQVLQLVEQISGRGDVPVLISGETGTGKELIARAIHELSGKPSGKFAAVNCATIRGDLVQSTLFGHKKGAFTGAVQNREGLFLSAQGGTLFLDEIQALDLVTQGMLLRAIQDRTVTPVGSDENVPYEGVRLLTASNVPLAHLIRNGDFREDLYYRLNVFQIEVPPLRERASDIPELLDWFLEKHVCKHNSPIQAVSEGVVHLMSLLPWPGNVRQLENAMESAIIRAQTGTVLDIEHLPPDVLEAVVQLDVGDGVENATALTLVGTRDQNPVVKVEVSPDMELADVVKAIERQMFRIALDRAGGNQSIAARILGVTRGKVRDRIKRFGLEETRTWHEA